jgi:hypothetical protein
MDDDPLNNIENENEDDSGVRINLISSRKLDSMTSHEKLRFIIDEVKKGTVLVLERGLTATEEINLIKATMSEIDHQTFIGIEMQSYSSDDLASRGGFFSRLLGRTKVPKMSVIGPANLLKTIHKNGSMIQAMILTGKSIVSEIPGDIDADEVTVDAELESSYTTEDNKDEVAVDDVDKPHALPIKGPKGGAELAQPVESVEDGEAEETETRLNGEISSDEQEQSASTVDEQPIEPEAGDVQPPMAQPIDVEPGEIEGAKEAESLEPTQEKEAITEEGEDKVNDSDQDQVSFLYKRIKNE